MTVAKNVDTGGRIRLEWGEWREPKAFADKSPVLGRTIDESKDFSAT